MNDTTCGVSIEEFLGTIFEGCAPDREIPVLTRPDGEGFVTVVAHPDTLKRACQPGQYPWYFCVSTVKTTPEIARGEKAPGRSRDELAVMYCVVLDDIGTKSLEPPVAPSWVLESSQGNYQWGYLLDPIECTPESIAHYEGCVDALGVAGYSDPGARGAYRIMRVPGSKHLTKNFVSRVTQWNPERFWALADLMLEMGVEPLRKRPHTPRDPNFVPPPIENCNDPVLRWLVETGRYFGPTPNKPGCVQVRCPWEKADKDNGVVGHSEGGAEFAMYSPVGAGLGEHAGAFNCLHGSCQTPIKRSRKHFRAWVARAGGPGAAPGPREVETPQMAQPSGYTPPRDLDEAEKAHMLLLRNHITEDGTAGFMSRVLAGEFQYPHGLDKWLRWDGTRWRPDQCETLIEAVRHYTRDVNVDSQKTVARRSFLASVVSLMRSDGRQARHHADYDRDNYLLGTPGGVVDLRTGVLRPAEPGDLITYQTRVTPQEGATPVFSTFLDEVTDGDVGVQAFLQRTMGSMLSGAIEDHWIMFWIGEGRNGKNTLGDLFEYILGDYATTVPADTLLAKEGQAHPTEIMALKGRRLVVSSEIEDGAYWAESRLNQVTGDATLSGRYMHKDFVTFPRTHKHLIYGNHEPRLKNVTAAIMSRVKIVPFKVSFVGREDKQMPAKLRREAGGVLSWLVQGHLQWLADGQQVGTCGVVEAATQDYFKAQSTIDQWLEESCTIVTEKLGGYPLSAWSSSLELYKDYERFKHERGEAALSMTNLSRKLEKRFRKIRRTTGVCFEGLRTTPLDLSQGNVTPIRPAEAEEGG